MSHGSLFLAGDIGGTNSRLQLWRVVSDPTAVLPPTNQHEDELRSPGGRQISQDEQLVREKIYSSQKFASLTFIIQQFLKEVAQELGVEVEVNHPIACCLAVAGPVRANRAAITNVNWVLDGAEMSEALKIPDVLIINDFVGVGYGLLALSRKDVVAIHDAPMACDAPKACIGAGTGLGEVYLTAGHLATSVSSSEDDHTEYNVWASEGGHADFAPRDALEFGLLEYFKTTERLTRVSVERIVSGLGIPKIYHYFCSKFPDEVNEEVTRRLLTEDPGAVIGEYAENGKCNLCRQTIELFVKCYGAEAGNMALKTLPFGGLYIAGGIAPKLLPFLTRNNLFFANFVQKGRMQGLLEKIPIFVVTNKAVGLLGAKVVCRRLLRRQGFMPGRGELAAFTEAAPRAGVSLGEVLAYPESNASSAFEAEVHLQPDGSNQPEKVILRRAQDSKQSRLRHFLTSQDVSAAVKNRAFVFGVIGGTIASVVSIAALAAINYLLAARRAPGHSAGRQL